MISQIGLQKGNILVSNVEVNKELLTEYLVIESIPNCDNDFTFEVRSLKEGFHSVIFLQHLQPVPITEDWLLKAGAKNDDDRYHFKGYYLHKHHSGVWNVFNHTTPHELTSLNFVHELQNWNFVLNKEELKFDVK